MVSYAATYYKFSPGEQDTITGWFKPLWTAEAIKVNIYPKGSSRIMMFPGTYCRLDAIGYTEYVVDEDGVLLQNDLHWTIVGKPEPWTSGDKAKFLVVQLTKRINFPVPMTEPVPPPGSSHFFGFEQIIAGVTEFEPGFERGWT